MNGCPNDKRGISDNGENEAVCVVVRSISITGKSVSPSGCVLADTVIQT